VPTIRTSKSGRLEVMVRLSGKKPVYKTMPEGTTPYEAKQWGLEQERSLKVYEETPTLVAKKQKQYTLRGLIDNYLAQINRAEAVKASALIFPGTVSKPLIYGKPLGNSYKNELDFLRRFMRDESTLCNKTTDQIRTRDIQAYVDKRLRQGHTMAYIYRDITVIRRIWREESRINRLALPNIFSKETSEPLAISQTYNERDRTATLSEIAAIYKSIQEGRSEKDIQRWTMLFTLLRYTAMTRSDVIKIRWSNFDLSRLTIDLSKDFTKKRSKRLLPIPDQLARYIKLYRDTLAAEDKEPNKSVFNLSVSAINQAWKRIVKRAARQGCKSVWIAPKHPDNLRLHDIRHTAITAFAYPEPYGLSREERAYMAGHKGRTQTEKYEHLELCEQIRKKLNNLPELPEDLWGLTVEDLAFDRAFKVWDAMGGTEPLRDVPDWIEEDGRILVGPQYRAKKLEQEIANLFLYDDRKALIVRQQGSSYEVIGHHELLAALDITGCDPYALHQIDEEIDNAERGIRRRQDYMILSDERIKNSFPLCKDVSALIQQVKDKGKLAPFIEYVTGEPTAEPFIL
jgi:integrase